MKSANTVIRVATIDGADAPDGYLLAYLCADGEERAIVASAGSATYEAIDVLVGACAQAGALHPAAKPKRPRNLRAVDDGFVRDLAGDDPKSS